VAAQVVVHRSGAALGQRLVVGIGTLGVGVTGNLDLQVGVTLQDLHRFAQDRNRVGTQGRLVEVEVHALQVDRDRHRATVRTDGLARLRIRALVVAVVDAVTVVIQVCAARGNRSRSRSRSRSNSLRAQRDHDADRSQQVAETIFVRSVVALIVEVMAVGQFGTNGNRLVEGGLQADTGLGSKVAVLALTRGSRVREGVELFFRLLVT